MLIFFDLGFNLFSIIPIFWNFSKVQKSHVSAELNEIVQYGETLSWRVCTDKNVIVVDSKGRIASISNTTTE